MENDLDGPLWTIVPHVDGDQDAVRPGALHQPVHRRLMAIEPAALAFERLQDESLEITEVIVDDAIHFSRE